MPGISIFSYVDLLLVVIRFLQADRRSTPSNY